MTLQCGATANLGWSLACWGTGPQASTSGMILPATRYIDIASTTASSLVPGCGLQGAFPPCDSIWGAVINNELARGSATFRLADGIHSIGTAPVVLPQLEDVVYQRSLDAASVTIFCATTCFVVRKTVAAPRLVPLRLITLLTHSSARHLCGGRRHVLSCLVCVFCLLRFCVARPSASTSIFRPPICPSVCLLACVPPCCVCWPPALTWARVLSGPGDRDRCDIFRHQLSRQLGLCCCGERARTRMRACRVRGRRDWIRGDMLCRTQGGHTVQCRSGGRKRIAETAGER